MNLKQKYLTVVFGTVLALGGVTGCGKSDNKATPAPAAQTQTQTAPQAPAQAAPQAAQPAAQPATDPAAAKALAKQNLLANMEAYDQKLLAADGFNATARLDYGNSNAAPPTGLVDPGMHFHGTSTTIEYAAVVAPGPQAPGSTLQAGEHVHIYVQHHGVGGDQTHTKFTAARGPAVPSN